MIKQELTLSDVLEDEDIESNYDNDYIDDDDNMDSQLDLPFIEETFDKSQQSHCNRPKLFECYLCHKTWPTVGTALNSYSMVTTYR